MYLLQLTNDYHYEGCDIYDICLSESKEKLDALIPILTEECIKRNKGFNELLTSHNAEYEPLRENKHQRTPEEVVIVNKKLEDFYNTFPLLTKFDKHRMTYDGVSEFSIKELKVI